MMIDALGMIETIGFIPAIAAADSALKSADVHIVQLVKVDGGIVTLLLSGDVSAVRSATYAGAEAARSLGTVRATHVIARLQQQVAMMLAPSERRQVVNVTIEAETAGDSWLVAVPPPNKRTRRKRAAENNE